MAETLLSATLVGALVLAFVFLRLTNVEDRLRAVSRVEAKLDALLKQAGVRFDPYEDVPPMVKDAVQRGRKIEAIKHYRAATGKGLREAKEFVEELERRRSS